MTTLYADVIVGISRGTLTGLSSYIVPEELKGTDCARLRCARAFRERGQLIRGFVIVLTETAV